MQMGDCYATLGDSGRAKECYLQAASLACDKAEPYIGLGVLAIEAGNLPDAEQAFRIALAKNVNCGEAYGGLAMTYQQQGQHAAAFEMYLKCLEHNSDNLMALLGLFQTSCRMGTFTRIIHYLEVFLAKHPDDVPVLFCLATLQARDGNLAAAHDTLAKILAIEPDKAEARDLIAEVESKLRHRESQNAGQQQHLQATLR